MAIRLKLSIKVQSSKERLHSLVEDYDLMINRNSSWFRMLAVMLGTGLLTIGAFVGCSSENAVTEKASSAAKPQTIEEKADAIVAAMTTNEKIGQMVMIGVHGTDIDDGLNTNCFIVPF